MIVPLYLLLFASTYFLMERASAANFTQPLTRTDALYFSVTVFTTVGFGDITAKSETARVVLIIQMLADLALWVPAHECCWGRYTAAGPQSPDTDDDTGRPPGKGLPGAWHRVRSTVREGLAVAHRRERTGTAGSLARRRRCIWRSPAAGNQSPGAPVAPGRPASRGRKADPRRPLQ